MALRNKSLAVLLLVVALCCTQARAQTWGEWFRQKKTQKKYLLEQIAALKVYSGYLKKGYELTRKGTGLIRDIKNGEFSLHRTFFDGLKLVSPLVKNDMRIPEIISLQLDILEAFEGLTIAEGLSAQQHSYVGEVKTKVLEDWRDDLAELILVITSGKLEMSDPERLKRLAALHEALLDRFAFVRQFSEEIQMLIRYRKKKEAELGFSYRMSGLKKQEP